MQVSMMVVGRVVFLLLGFVLFGGPMILVDYARKRRHAAAERQIALTDALDGRLGAVVAPVVTKRRLGPWEIRLAVPRNGSAATAEMLSVVDDLFSDVAGKDASTYRIVLSAKPDSVQGLPVSRSVRPWAGGARAAA